MIATEGVPSPEYEAPETLADVLAALARPDVPAQVLAGGQSLLRSFPERLRTPYRLLDLRRVDELRRITTDGDHLVVGAMATHHAVAQSALVASHARLLQTACSVIGDPQVRHRGTVGGALVHADPASDAGAAAMALDVELILGQSGGRSRTVSVKEFFTEPFRTVVHPDELLTHVRIHNHGGWMTGYERFTRIEHQWPVVGVACTLRMDGDRIGAVRIGLAGLGTTPLRASSVEQMLLGEQMSEQVVGAAAEAVLDDIAPLSGIDGGRAHREQLAPVITRRAVLRAARRYLPGRAPWEGV